MPSNFEISSMNPKMAFLNTAFQLGKSFLGNKLNLHNAKETAKYQNIMNLRNWHLQNAYNSPQMLMKRLSHAGLNPNLAYQNISPAGQVQPSPVANPTVDFADVNPLSDYVSLQHSANEVTQTNSSVAETDNRINNIIAEREILKLEKQLKDVDLKWYDREKYQSFVNSQQQGLVLHNHALNLEASTGLTRRQIDSFYLSLQNTLDNDKVKRQLGRANIASINKTMSLLDRQISNAKTQGELMNLEYLRGVVAYRIERDLGRQKFSKELQEIQQRIENLRFGTYGYSGKEAVGVFRLLKDVFNNVKF